MLRHTFLFLLLCAPLNFAQGAEITLEKISDNIPEIGLFKSSEFVPPIGGKVISLSGEKFEVRFFFFQDTREPDRHISFKEYLRNSATSKIPGRVMNLGYGQIIVFLPNDAEKEEGIHYMLSLRSLEHSLDQKDISVASSRKVQKQPLS